MIFNNYTKPSFYNDGLDPNNAAPFTSRFYASLDRQLSAINQEELARLEKENASWLPSAETMETIGHVVGAALEVGLELNRQSQMNAQNNTQIGFNYNRQTTTHIHQHHVTEAERKLQQDRHRFATRAAGTALGAAVAAPAAHQATKRLFVISDINDKISELKKFARSFDRDRKQFADLPHLQRIDEAIACRHKALKRERNYQIGKIASLATSVASGALLAMAALSAPHLMGIGAALMVPTALSLIVTWTAASKDKTSRKCNLEAESIFKELQSLRLATPHYLQNGQPKASAPMMDETFFMHQWQPMTREPAYPLGINVNVNVHNQNCIYA